MRTVLFRAVLFATASGVTPGVLHAQACRPDELVPWWPRRLFVLPTSRADRAAMDATLQVAEDLVRKTVYGTPRGFAVSPARS